MFLVIIILLPILYIVSQSYSLISRFALIAEGNFGGRSSMGCVCLRVSENFYLAMVFLELTQSYQYLGYAGETPHNIILQTLIYAGIPGLFFYSLFIYRIFKASYICYRDINLLMPALLVSPLLGYFMLTQSISEKIVWVMMAYIAGTYLFNNSRRTSSKAL